MLNKIRIAVATYTNTLPFLKGINESLADRQDVEIKMSYPSACAQMVIEDTADIGIIPIQALMDIPNYRIIGDYCIGSDGYVDSVFLFSSVPVEQIRTLRLDGQSKTSNGLARILLKNYWKREIEVVESDTADAFVLIGDRTFGQKDSMPYVYDLGYYWKEFTGLPFAFAVWGANKELPESFVSSFNEALSVGISRIDEVIAELPVRDDFDFRDYLTSKLDFRLTPEKRQAIQLYHQLFEELPVVVYRS